MAEPEAPSRPFEAHRFLGRLNLHAGTPPAQFILYNHVTDYYYYGSMRFLPMRATLMHYLCELGYEIVAIFNLSESLLFADEPAVGREALASDGRSMRQRYWELISQPNTIVRDPLDAEVPMAASGATGTNPPQTTGESPTQIITNLGLALRQAGPATRPLVRMAVIVERLQNLLSNQPVPEDRAILDQLQSWSALTNGNIALLVADVAQSSELPAALAGNHRSGVMLVNVGLPGQAERRNLFTLERVGLMAHQFAQGSNEVGSRVAEFANMNQLIDQLEGCDALTIASYFNECGRRGVKQLDLYTLRMIRAHTRDLWSTLFEHPEQTLLQIKQLLEANVLGQAYALNEIMRTMRLVQRNLQTQARTRRTTEGLLAYFFFAGPTGVGKTEVFRILSQTLTGIPSRKFNMPEYKEEHSVARFFGAPPGYVGYGRGELGEFLIDNPAAVVLFDEFEKAHPNVGKNFLTMLEGSMTTGDGVRVDLSQVIFIFTSNAGAERIQRIDETLANEAQQQRRDQNRTLIKEELGRTGAPAELIGRLFRRIIPFNHMTEPVIRLICKKKLSRLADEMGGVSFHPSVVDWLLDKYAQQPDLGARQIEHLVSLDLLADILDFPTGSGIIYKDAGGQTRYAAAAEALEVTYQRQHRT